jgi:hypothetical protein
MNRRSFLKFSLLAAASGTFALDSKAQTTTGTNPTWDNLTDAQKDELRQKWKRFKSLPADKQERIRTAFRRFQGFSPEKKERIRANFQRWKNLNADQKSKIRTRHQRWMKLTPEQRRNLKMKWMHKRRQNR